MIPKPTLRRGHIIGIVDAYGAVHSHFTGETVKHHDEYWPGQTHCRWRWCDRQSLWFIAKEQAPKDEETWDSIRRHCSKKYDLKWWENGHHDIDDLHGKRY